MKINYDGQEYTIEEICAPRYRIYCKEIDVYIVLSMEWKGGSYFKIDTVYKGGKAYSAQRYHYKWIPLCREATFIVAKEKGLWDYSNNELKIL